MESSDTWLYEFGEMLITMRNYLLLILILVQLSACSPSLGNGRIEITPIEVNYADFDLQGARVFVQDFSDARKVKVIGEIDGRFLTADTPVAPSIRFAIEEALTEAGADLTMLNAAMLSGKVHQWYMRVTPDFPLTKANAIARISFKVTDQQNRIIYVGSYEGAQTMRHLGPEKRDTEYTLKAAMANAIRAALKDQALVDAIVSSQGPVDTGTRMAQYDW